MADGSPTITPAPAPISRAPWTTREIRVLREAYPGGGINGVIVLLPHRSRSAIYQHANALGLRCASQPLVRESWKLEPGMNDAIRAAHQRPMKRGDVVALAKRLARPVWWVSRRARELGLTTPRFREPHWCAEEIAILRDTNTLAPAAVQRALRRAGYRRTATAIAVQRKRHGIHRQAGDNYTISQAATMLGMDPSTLLRDVRAGLVVAKPNTDYITRTDGRPAQYVITERNLRDYIVRHPVRLNLRKLPAGHVPWFIELIAGTAGHSVEEVRHG